MSSVGSRVICEDNCHESYLLSNTTYVPPISPLLTTLTPAHTSGTQNTRTRRIPSAP